jgi:hypothetical protein
MKASITLLVCGITKEEARKSTVLKFMSVVGSSMRKTKAVKTLEYRVIWSFF